ncbi:MAG: hypothetical protein V1926_03960 [Candidatus Peregrinibacteria bacterium]
MCGLSCLKNPKCSFGLLLRISFGVSLLFMGLTHYMNLAGFVAMARDGMGALEFVGVIWAYILPALMILGGALVAVGLFPEIGVAASAVALGSIPVGMLARPVLTGVSVTDVMPAAINAFIWLIVLFLVVKTMGCCCGGYCSEEGGSCCSK